VKKFENWLIFARVMDRSTEVLCDLKCITECVVKFLVDISSCTVTVYIMYTF